MGIFAYRNDKSKVELKITKVRLGNITRIPANSSAYLWFNISNIITDFDEVMGIRTFRFANTTSVDINSLTIGKIELERNAGNLYYRLAVYNNTSSTVELGTQTNIDVITLG